MTSCRPPTPPRPSASFSPTKNELTSASSTLLASSANSPSTSTTPGTPVSGRSAKRVDFSPWNAYHKAPDSYKSKYTLLQLRAIPPSNECKPAKSILKASAAPEPTKPTEKSFAAMLESVVQQMAGDSLASRMDAYNTLANALKAYRNTPDRKALLDKLDLLCQFIRRDITKKPGDGEMDPKESNLTTQALSLISTFLWEPEISKALKDDFRQFVVDQSIDALTNCTTKTHLNHYMHILAAQNFSSKIMTTDRGNRILNDLQEIDVRVTGHGILCQRLLIYQRLIGQVRPIMVGALGEWTEHLFEGLFSSHKDVRLKAISVGLDAARTLGTSVMVSLAFRDILATPSKDGKALVMDMQERLLKMLAAKDGAQYIPQIWSIVVVFLRSFSPSFSDWAYFKAWMAVIQKCLNCSDSQIRLQAYTAWNRFIYTMSCSTRRGATVQRMLAVPVTSQYLKSASWQRPVRQAIPSTYCTLLYYFLEPKSTHAQLSTHWAEYVVAPMESTFTSTVGASFASEVLANLLGTATQKPWTKERVFESRAIEPSELPALDCRWVRARSQAVLRALEPLLKNSDWKSGEAAEAPVGIAWKNFTRSLGEASSKEIKASKEATQAIGNVLSLFNRLWEQGPASLGAKDSETFFGRFQYLTQCLFGSLGIIPFSDTVLTKTLDGFAVQATPSSSSSGGNESKAPLQFLFRIITSKSVEGRATPTYRQLVKSLIEETVKSKTSRGHRLEQFRQVFDDLAKPASSPDASACLAIFWSAICALAIDLLNFPLAESTSSNESIDTFLSHARDFVNVVKLLGHGIAQQGDVEEWSTLLSTAAAAFRREGGRESLSNTIVEPLAKQLSSPNATEYATALIKVVSHEAGNHTLAAETASMIRLGPKPRLATTSTEHFIAMVNYHLLQTHAIILQGSGPVAIPLIEASTTLLQSASAASAAPLLRSLQPGISCWLEDKQRQIPATGKFVPEVASALAALCSACAMIITRLSNHSAAELASFEALLVAGLRSSHRSVATRFIEVWNETFAKQEELEYPAAVQKALMRLHNSADIQAPGLTILDLSNQIDSDGLDYVSSQESESDTIHALEKRHRQRFGSPRKINSSSPMRLISSPAKSGNQHKMLGPRTVPTPSPAKITPRKLRHQDSQLEFVAIESSPLPAKEMDSQSLTDRQKEIRERQREAAAMFSDLRQNVPEELEVQEPEPQLPSSSLRARFISVVEDGPTTPILSGNGAEDDDDYITSSPTPKAKTKLQMDELDIPSSPPSFQPVEEVVEPAERKSPIRIDLKTSTPKNTPPVSPRVTRSALRRRTAAEAEANADSESGEANKKRPKLATEKAAEQQVRPSQRIDDDSDGAEEQLASQLTQEMETTSTNNPAPEPNTTKTTAALPTEEANDSSSDLEMSDPPDDLLDEPPSPIETEIEKEKKSTPSPKKRKRSQSSSSSQLLMSRPATRRRSARLSQVEGAEGSFEVVDFDGAETVMDSGGLGSVVLESAEVAPVGSVTEVEVAQVVEAEIEREVQVEVEAEAEIGAEAMQIDDVNLEPEPEPEEGPEPEPEEGPDSESEPEPRLEPEPEAEVEVAEVQAVETEQEGPTVFETAEEEEQEISLIEETLLGQGEDVIVEEDIAIVEPIATIDATEPETQIPMATLVLETTTTTETLVEQPPDEITEMTAEVPVVQDDQPLLPTESGLLSSLRSVLGQIRRATIDMTTLRQVDDLMFEMKVEAHQAARRGSGNGDGDGNAL